MFLTVADIYQIMIIGSKDKNFLLDCGTAILMRYVIIIILRIVKIWLLSPLLVSVVALKEG